MRRTIHEHHCLHQADSRSRDPGRATFASIASKREAERGAPNLVTNIFLRELAGNGAAISRGSRRQDHGCHLRGRSGRRSLRKALALPADDAVLIAIDAPRIRILSSSLARWPPASARSASSTSCWSVASRGIGARGKPADCSPKNSGRRASRLPNRSNPPRAGKVQVKRQTDSGWELFESATPLVITITNHEKNVPRIPKTRDVMQSYRKPLTKWTLSEVGVDPACDRGNYYQVGRAVHSAQRNAVRIHFRRHAGSQDRRLCRARDRNYALDLNPSDNRTQHAEKYRAATLLPVCGATPVVDRSRKALLGAGRRLADVSAAKLRAAGARLSRRSAGRGSAIVADTVVVVEDELLAEYHPEVTLTALTAVCKKLSPQAVLLGNDTYGQELRREAGASLGGKLLRATPSISRLLMASCA